MKTKRPYCFPGSSRQPRKPRGQYFRRFIGGEFADRTEPVPIFPKATLKTIVQKQLWDGLRLVANNSYKLTEPVTKPQNGATYIYEAL